MENDLDQARDHFIQGMSRISSFWGFPKAMGAIFGVLYLSPEPLSLDGIGEMAGVTKGAVSTNVRALERLGIVHRLGRRGDRRDYYAAESDLWKVAKGVLEEREKSEFDRALRTVGESLEIVRSCSDSGEKIRRDFYKSRLEELHRSFSALDRIVAGLLALDDLRHGSLGTVMGAVRKKR